MKRLLVGCLLLLLLAACSKGQAFSADRMGSLTATPGAELLPTPSPTQTPTAKPGPPATPTARPLRRVSNVPGLYRIRIPRIGLEAAIVPVGLERDGSLAAPPGPDLMGIYNVGPAPGEKGNVLLTAHLDWLDRQTGVARTALCWECKNIEIGSPIVIQDGEQGYTYKVTTSVKLRYDDPEAIKMMYGYDEAILTLITCEGPEFDQKARNYLWRRIIVAALQ